MKTRKPVSEYSVAMQTDIKHHLMKTGAKQNVTGATECMIHKSKRLAKPVNLRRHGVAGRVKGTVTTEVTGSCAMIGTTCELMIS